jgi:hypothetical protein
MPLQPDYLSQPVGRPRISGMAITALVLGILAVPTCFLTGIPAIILGILSLRKINRQPNLIAGAGFAIAGISTGAASFATTLLVAILMPSLSPSHALSNRSYCAANLRGIAQSMMIYAQDNSDAYPITNGTSDGKYSVGLETSGIDTDNLKTLNYLFTTTPGGTTAVNDNNPSHVLWILVLRQQIAPKQLICKSDPFGSSAGVTETDASNRYFKGPTDFGHLSYSIAYPWAVGKSGPQPYWRDSDDASIPLMSDMALYGADTSSSSPKDYNSPNHNGDGQNVGFADCHVDFYRDPLCGQSGDNIFGFGPADAATATHKFRSTTAAGTRFNPVSTEIPYDTTMIPTRSATSKDWR